MCKKLFYSILFVLFVASCDKNEHIINEHIIDEHKYEVVISDFLSKYESVNNKVSFIFFTDPHLLSGGDDFSDDVKSKIDSSLLPMKELYTLLPLNFCLCGGDWLNQRDGQYVAKQKLLYVDHQMKKMFSPYYKMLGNHDTNYQGFVSSIDSTRGDLSREFLEQYYFSETGSAYYSFRTNNTQFFILDSGLDWELQMDSYRWEQVKWLAKGLFECESQHIVLGIHMFYENYITPMSEIVASLSRSYNNHESFVVENEVYDFSNTQGTIHAVLSGHSHIDAIDYYNDIPIVRTCAFYENQSFDLCILNYDTNYMDLIRVGYGEGRHIKLAI